MIDINELMITYVAVDKRGRKKELNIIVLDTLIAKIGEYDPNHFPYVDDYMSDVVDNMCNFIASPYDITWYARYRSESDIVEAVTCAVREGNNIIVMEYIDED